MHQELHDDEADGQLLRLLPALSVGTDDDLCRRMKLRGRVTSDAVVVRVSCDGTTGEPRGKTVGPPDEVVNDASDVELGAWRRQVFLTWRDGCDGGLRLVEDGFQEIYLGRTHGPTLQPLMQVARRPDTPPGAHLP